MRLTSLAVLAGLALAGAAFAGLLVLSLRYVGPLP